MWHSEFKFQGYNPKSINEFLSLIEDQESVLFLKQWFDSSSEEISVQTSGSTGNPKLISLKKKQMIASAEATGHYFNLLSGSAVLHVLPTKFIAGKMMWVRALVLGWNLYLEDELNHYDFSAMVPLQVYKREEKDLNRFQTILIGGGVYDLNDLNRFVNLKTRIYASYGMTETITHIAIMQLAPVKEEFYHSLPGVKLGVDERNCLHIEAKRIARHSIQTNDLVELIDQKQFKWLGRWDNIINSGGVKLSPEAIENKLQDHFKTPFFIAGQRDSILGERLVIIQEGFEESHELSERERKEFLLMGLEKFEIPKAVYFLPSFVYTQTKKIQRRETLDLVFS